MILILCILYLEGGGAKDDWVFRISDLVKKTVMELIFNPW